jgi:4'-phosphopantetheinyl transferase
VKRVSTHPRREDKPRPLASASFPARFRLPCSRSRVLVEAIIAGRDAPVERPEIGVVDVWVASLDRPPALLPSLAELLSPDERDRADRFVRRHDRERFVAGRAFLRLLLSRLVGSESAALRFAYGPNGKPALEAPADLAFNLAHSGGLAVCAVAAGRSGLGVDVERVRPLGDLAGMARAAFAPGEAARIVSLPEPERLLAFFDAWTRKEALLKALGRGLGRPLGEDAAALARLSLQALTLDEEGCAGAVAAVGRNWRLRRRRWSWSAA